MQYVGGLKVFLAPYRRTLYVVFFCLILEALFFSGLNYSFKFIMDALLNGNKRLLELVLSFFFCGTALVSIIVIVRDYFYSWVVANLMRDIRYKMYRHLGRLSMDYYAREQTGTILSHFSSNVSAIENGMYSVTAGAVYPALSLIFNLILLSLLSWKLALIAIITCPVPLIGPHKITSRLMQEIQEKKSKDNALASLTYESIITQPTVKAFGLFDYISGRFAKLNQDLVGETLQVNFLTQLILRWAELSPMFLQVLSWSVAGYMAYQHYITPSAFVAFTMIYGTLIYAMMRVTYCFPSLIQGAAGIRMINSFLNEKPTVPDGAGILPLPHQPKEIALQNVSFGYQENGPNLNDIACVIPPGKSVAFVGPSGSGKSTILQLVMRFYDPTTGAVRIDGIDYRSLAQESLYSVIGYVSQESLLFNTTIMENIRFGKLNATDEEVIAAARAAEIHDDISNMLHGYETVIGERGGRLSGGQKQRLAIARAILRQPAIFVLDEITASLDPATESAIIRTLGKLTQGRTSISATHRLSSITHADRIYVVQKGKICEQGTHDELLAHAGLYKNIWEKQHGFILNAQSDETKITAEGLENIPIFKNLPRDLLERIIPHFHTYHYSEDQTILEEGELGDLFFIIARGKVGVYKQSDGKNMQKIATLSDGDYFGEIALLKSVPRTATVKTISPCIFLTLRHRDFISLLDEAPGLRQILENKLTERGYV